MTPVTGVVPRPTREATPSPALPTVTTVDGMTAPALPYEGPTDTGPPPLPGHEGGADGTVDAIAYDKEAQAKADALLPDALKEEGASGSQSSSSSEASES